MIRIYADFNSRDEQGRVMLDTVGSLSDIAKHTNLADGMTVLLYMGDDFEVEGVLVFDQVWRATPDMATLRYPEDQ